MLGRGEGTVSELTWMIWNPFLPLSTISNEILCKSLNETFLLEDVKTTYEFAKRQHVSNTNRVVPSGEPILACSP